MTRKHVLYAWTGYSGELPKRKRRTRLRPQPATVKLTHAPTGVSVSGEVPFRRLSRRAMQDELMRLRKSLLPQLEKAVRSARRARRRQ